MLKIKHLTILKPKIENRWEFLTRLQTNLALINFFAT